LKERFVNRILNQKSDERLEYYLKLESHGDIASIVIENKT